MKTAVRLLPALLCLTAMETQGAALSFLSAMRNLQGGETLLAPNEEFADFEASLVGMVFDPNAGARPGCTASQRSLLRAETITVVSEISGDAGRGFSLFHVTFHLDEAAAYSLTGNLNLLGTTGFACVSFQDLAHRDTTLINEVIFAPPQVSGSRLLGFTGTLEAGDYLLEAMIYGGGDNLSTQGSLTVVFSIPEPATLLLLASGALLTGRRRKSMTLHP